MSGDIKEELLEIDNKLSEKERIHNETNGRLQELMKNLSKYGCTTEDEADNKLVELNNELDKKEGDLEKAMELLRSKLKKLEETTEENG